jgi:hypothetical protein
VHISPEKVSAGVRLFQAGQAGGKTFEELLGGGYPAMT